MKKTWQHCPNQNKSETIKWINEHYQSCWRLGVSSEMHSFILTVRGGAPFLEVLQYQVDAWSGRSKPLLHLPVPKINLIYGPRVGDVSDIKLIRTDTTLDLSQKAEKRYLQIVRLRAPIPRSVTLISGFRGKLPLNTRSLQKYHYVSTYSVLSNYVQRKK